jgi:hypothetical protein
MEQLEQPHPHDDLPLRLSLTSLVTIRATTTTSTAQTINVPIINTSVLNNKSSEVILYNPQATY